MTANVAAPAPVPASRPQSYPLPLPHRHMAQTPPQPHVSRVSHPLPFAPAPQPPQQPVPQQQVPQPHVAPAPQPPQQQVPQPHVAPAPQPPQQPVPQQQIRSRWATFEQLGLGPPRPRAPHAQGQQQLSQKTAQLMISAYRLMGFGVLSIIVLVLVGYIATSTFYFVSDSWIQPIVISSTDERVLSLEAQLAAQENTRDRLVADLHHAERYIEVQQAFQAQFADAIRADLVGRKQALRRLEALASEYKDARRKIRSSNQAFASASRKRMSREYRAGLLDRSDLLSGKYQLAQITSSSLSLAERQAEFEARAVELETQASALEAILSEKGNSVLSYDVLRIKQEYELSRLETAKAIENRKILQASLERQEAVVETLRQSPLLRAMAANASVAFVPYSNMNSGGVGASVYGCHLEMIFCGKVGEVLEVLPGEVTFKHPHREKILRGQMVSIELDDPKNAEDEVLFLGGSPLLL